MARLTLTDISAGYALTTTINANNALIEAFAELVIMRDGTATNTWSANQDANSKNLNNLPDATANQQPVTLAQLNAASVTALTAAGTAVTIADAAGNFTATNAEAAFAELFTGAFTHTGNIVLNTADLLVGDTDFVTFGDGTDFTMTWDGSFMVFDTAAAARTLKLHSALGVSFYDTNDTNVVRFSHDATDFNIAGTGTTDINITGITRLNMTGVDCLLDVLTASVSVNLPGATTANLADVSAAVNTSADKVQGSLMYNTDTDNPVYAVGAADGDVWVGADGATLHTPV